MSKAILIIDPQYDFINGSLPVPGAEQAMVRLSEYLEDTDGKYVCKMISADWHPYDHFSFTEEGGPWPRHCVRFSKGASIFDPVLSSAHATKGDVHILTKGTQKDKEEYSVFQNPESCQRIHELVKQMDITDIDICGLAGDVCVLNSLLDALKQLPKCRINVLKEFSPSLDGGEKLTQTIENLNLNR